MNKFKVTAEYGTTTIIEADYMEVGGNLVFKNREANTCVAAFSSWTSVVTVTDEDEE